MYKGELSVVEGLKLFEKQNKFDPSILQKNPIKEAIVRESLAKEKEVDILDVIFKSLPSQISPEQGQVLSDIEIQTQELKELREEITLKEEQLENLMQLQYEQSKAKALNNIQEEYQKKRIDWKVKGRLLLNKQYFDQRKPYEEKVKQFVKDNNVPMKLQEINVSIDLPQSAGQMSYGVQADVTDDSVDVVVPKAEDKDEEKGKNLVLKVFFILFGIVFVCGIIMLLMFRCKNN